MEFLSNANNINKNQYIRANLSSPGKNDKNNRTEVFSIEAENIAQRKEKTEVEASIISNEVQTTLIGVQEQQSESVKSQELILSTTKGAVKVNLDEYFSPPKNQGRINLDEIPLLLPNAENLKALSVHAEERFNELLEKYNIPHAPEEITYNSEGKIILPNDYPYSNELKQALKENEGIDRELRTLHALTSHFAEIQKSIPFHEEFSKAETRVEEEAIVAKYSHLFDDNRNYSSITLSFKDETLNLLADGKTIKLA